MSFRLLRISFVSRSGASKVCGFTSKLSQQRFPLVSTFRTQVRTAMNTSKKPASENAILTRTSSEANESSYLTLGRLAYAVKLVRLPFLIVAISSIGYQRGVTDAIRNPLKLQQGAFETMLSSFAVESEDEVQIITERGVRSRLDTPIGTLTLGKTIAKDPRAEKVSTVGREILKSAQTFVRENLDAAAERAKERILQNETYVKERRLTKLINEDPEVEHWIEALEHIEGASFEGIENWSYVLISSPIPNAFVSEMLPQKIFVTTGLFDKFVRNEDELAIILGHEVSHLLKGHVSRRNTMESIIRGAEIIVLMLDPTEGILSLGIAGILMRAREALVAAFSRTQETEADELGCKLAAMSCYDTRRGIEVFRKMQEESVVNGTSSSTQSAMSSHPPSQARYDELLRLTETENFSEYGYCNTMKRKIARAFKKIDY